MVSLPFLGSFRGFYLQNNYNKPKKKRQDKKPPPRKFAVRAQVFGKRPTAFFGRLPDSL
jgi:hypothetical protein